MVKYLVLAGKLLDRAFAAVRAGMLLARPSDVHTLRPGSCANTAEEVRGADLSVLEGLISPSDECLLELFVPGRGERRTLRGVEFRVCPEELPRGAFLELSPRILMFSPAQYYLLKCRELTSLIDRVTLGMELCGTYAHNLPGHADLPCTFFVGQALPVEALRAYLARAKGLYGVKAARAAAELVLDNSYSPMETIVALEQCLPLELGGRGYPTAELNTEICVPEHLRHLVDRDRFKPDIYWPGTDVEYEGFVHNSAAAVEADKARLADIQALGIQVIPATAFTMRTSERAELLGRQIGESLVAHGNTDLRRRLRVLEDADLMHERALLHGRLMAPLRARGAFGNGCALNSGSFEALG